MRELYFLGQGGIRHDGRIKPHTKHLIPHRERTRCDDELDPREGLASRYVSCAEREEQEPNVGHAEDREVGTDQRSDADPTRDGQPWPATGAGQTVG